jgi:hypothetical protein
MATAVADPALRRHTVRSDTDVRGVCRALGTAGTARVVAARVRNVEVRWRAVGSVDTVRITAILASTGRPMSAP